MTEEKKPHVGNISLPPNLQSPEIREDNRSEIENFPMIINTQRAAYENLLADLKHRIDRVLERNRFLVKLIEKMSISHINQTAEAEKEVVQLNNDIVNESKKIENLYAKMKSFLGTENAVMNSHYERVKTMNEKFEKKRISLYSELKNLNATINAVENYKLAEAVLREKFDNNAKYIQGKEEEMRKNLDQIELTERIHKESLKKESYNQILIVSGHFQQILRDNIPASVQRLMRENIVLENELDRLWNDHINMEDLKSSNGNRIEDYREKIKSHKKDENGQMVKIKLQHMILKKLKTIHATHKKMLAKSSKPSDNFEKNYLKLIEDLKSKESVEDDFHRRKLEVFLHRERIKQNLAKAFESKSALALDKCTETLDFLKNTINSAMGNDKQKSDDYLKNMRLEELSYYLLDAIDKFDAKKCIFEGKSLETIGTAEEIYATGDLGFNPQHIEIEDEISRKVEKIRSSSVQSALEVLKELEHLTTKVSADEDQKSEPSTISESSSSEKYESSKESKSSIKDKDQKTISDEYRSIQSGYENEMEGDYDDYMYYLE